MLLIVRFGLLFWLLTRALFLFERLRARFRGDALLEHELLELKVLRNKGRIIRVQLGIPVPKTLRFAIRREKYWDRVAKQLGLAHEFQTGDRKFDENAYILSDDRALLMALATHPEFRNTIHSLLTEAAVEWIRCNAGRLWIDCKASVLSERKAQNDAIGRELGAKFGPRLNTLKELATALGAQSWEAARDPAISRESIFYVFAILLAIAGIAAFFWTLGGGLPRTLLFDNAERLAVGVTAGGLALLVTAALVFLRGTSRLHLVLLEIFITMTPAAWCVARTWYAHENVQKDTSAGEEALLRIRQHYTTTHKNSKSYWLVVDAWPDSRIDPKIGVQAPLYAATSAGQCLQVHWHHGYLGDPWVESWQANPRCALND